VIRPPRGPVRALVAVTTALVATVSGVAAAPSAPAATPLPVVSPPGSKIQDDRIVVRMKAGARRPRAARAISSTSVPGSGDVHLIAVPRGKVSDEIARLRKDPEVEVAQPDHVYSVSATNTPNDLLYPYQWGPGNISAPQAWVTTTGDPSASAPVVAVLDTGMDYTHPDLEANAWLNVNGIGGCAPGTHGYNAITGSCDPMDDTGHGTHVSGTVAAVGNNGIGVTGIAWQAKLMAVKLLDRNGNGDDFTAIRAINWVIAAKQKGVNVRVINASWGGLGKDQLLEDAITTAWNNGILFVTAAGNDTTNNDDPSGATFQDPCGAPQAVCVAAINQQGQLAPFSNWGVNTVALAAPGDHIASTLPGNTYADWSGTSMATPHVAGAAALVTVTQPGMSVSTLRNRIVNSVDKRAALSGVVKSGGSLNVCKAIAGCGGNAAIAPTAPIDVSATTVKGVAKVTWKPPASNGGAAVSYSVTSTASSGSQPANTPYQQSGLGSGNGRVIFSVTASNAKGSSPPASITVLMLGGGYVLDGWGGLHGFASSGATPPAPSGGPYWDGWDIARGVALLPSGTGGYVLDGFGGLHAFAIGAGPAPPPAVGGPYWQGWDIARGVTILSDGTGGYVLDGFGGLHPFAVGGETIPGPVTSSPYWSGWDIARGVAIVPNPGATTGGYVLDGYGGLHAFGIAGGPPPAAPVGASYWDKWDVARGVTVAHDGSGGLVGDGFGVLHGWGTGNSPPPPASGGPYWAQSEIARSVAL
jgi:subtilisin family serine protease